MIFVLFVLIFYLGICVGIEMACFVDCGDFMLDAYNLLCVLLWPYFVYQAIKWKKEIKELNEIIED